MDISNLHKEAQNIYNELNIIIDPNDALALYMLVVTYSTYLDATEHLQTEGKVIEGFDSHGNPINRPNPWVKIQLDSQIQLFKLVQEFGFSPKSKNKIQAATAEASPLSNILNRLVEVR